MSCSLQKPSAAECVQGAYAAMAWTLLETHSWIGVTGNCNVGASVNGIGKVLRWLDWIVSHDFDSSIETTQIFNLI